MIPSYDLTTDPAGLQIPAWSNVVFGFTVLNVDQLDKISSEHGRKYTGGANFITFCCEPTKFLPYLMKRLLAAGGRFEKRRVESLDELEDADLIVNCTGLGSQSLIEDFKLQPIRGQVARVKAPWIFHVIMHKDDDGNYVIPNTHCVILGGTHQAGDYNTNLSSVDSDFILNGCQRMTPSLRNAEKISEVVGLRPGREAVRLEIEERDGKPTVIHNIGHGGCGVSLTT